MQLGSVGVWSGALRRGNPEAIIAAATELEHLGYGTLWFPGADRDGLEDLIRGMLGATQHIVVASGILSIWIHPAAEVAAMHHRLEQDFPGRWLLGLGVSHGPAVERTGQQYARPLLKMQTYLDELDAAAPPVPVDQRILAALGPRMLELARDRTLGTHPYFVTPEHTRVARAAVGPGKVVAPEQMVVLETDPERARAVARANIDRYLHAPNYTNNLLRFGFTEADFANGGSDKVVDAIVAWGTPEQITARVAEHHAAGADHVCIQVLSDQPQVVQMEGFRRLAATFK